MYHFTADHPPEPVRLSFRTLIPGHIRQYLRDFQVDAIRFMHNFLAKGEFCVYNDESGLGKQASVVVLLDGACSSRKCLIVVQNDDRYVNGWEFHFNVLTNTNVTVIKDEKDTTDSAHSIYIAKWSTLRTIDDLSKFKFDFIILDNRGQMLNNSFCTSMLLKHYERKINILISSVDITSDLKLLHNALRLGGRLEPQYNSFKMFDEKFKLPDAKELAYKRVDLEEYFCKRERLADYCKAFRLRRYCHQFETQLPLVKEDRYKINLGLWREKQNATNSESSSIEYANHLNRDEGQIKDTQELFEEYCRQRRKQHLQFQQEEEERLQQREREMLTNLETEKEIIYNVDDDEIALINETPPSITERTPAARDNSDEQVLMSPLMVESDSDVDDIPEICKDAITDIEIVDLSSEEKDGENHNKPNKEKNADNENIFEKRSYKKRTELDRLEENIVDSLKIKKQTKRLSRNAKGENDSRPTNRRMDHRFEKKISCGVISKNKRLSEKKSKYSENTCNVNSSLKRENKTTGKSTTSKNILETPCNENPKGLLIGSKKVVQESCTVSKSTKNVNDKNTSKIPNPLNKGKKLIQDNINKNEIIDTNNLSSKKTTTNENQVAIKQEVLEETPHAQKIRSKYSQVKVNGEKVRLKREMQISPVGIHHKQTRSMQRLTRSVGGSKYSTRNLSLQIDKISKTKKITSLKVTPKSVDIKKNKKVINEDNTKTNKNVVKNTQTSIISHRSSQEYESLQCAQRLSDAAVFDNVNEKTTEFLVPPTPTAILRNSLLPSSLTSSSGFLTESQVIFIPPSNRNITANRKRDLVILLSSSDNENSTSQSSSTNVSMTSRRTRALKPKRNQHQQQTVADTNNVPNFSDFLTPQNTRSSAKSPDLFSNCSDLIQLPCTQPNLNSEEPNAPFEGFKIFGSEVKQLQQHYASNNNNANKHDRNIKKSYREQRSCLDILENMFEPSNRKTKQLSNAISSTSTKKSSRSAAPAIKQKPHTQILPSHPIEAITEARQQQEKQKRKRSTATSSSELQDDDIFEITNNGTFGSVMRLHSNGDISPVQITQKINTKQHNKITNYLIGNVIQNDSQEEVTPNSGNNACNFNTEAGTPSKRNQHLYAAQNINIKKSPKGKCNTTQATKLTKWFTKPSELNGNESSVREKSSNLRKTTTKQVQTNPDNNQNIATLPSQSHAAGKRILKRRRLDLSFNK